MQKTVLVHKSQGQRGQNGKKKIYEIVLDGNKVVLSWGKAEENARQTQTKWFANEVQAKWFAFDKKIQKMDKGYELVLTA